MWRASPRRLEKKRRKEQFPQRVWEYGAFVQRLARGKKKKNPILPSSTKEKRGGENKQQQLD